MPITNQCFMEMVNDMDREYAKEGHRNSVHQRQRPEETYREAIVEYIKKYSLYYNREHSSHSFA